MTFEMERSINAAPYDAWTVIADVGGYHRLADGLTRVEVLDGDREGMMRRCYDRRGRGWTETCTLWEDGRRYAFAVDTTTFPRPLRQLLRRFEGTWTVAPDESGSRIGARFVAVPRFGFLGRALVRLTARESEAQLRRLLDRWESEAAKREPGGVGSAA